MPSDRPPTASERARLRELYAALGSKEKVYMAAWGSKNGKVHSWLTDALAEVTATGDIEARITSPLTRESITVYAQRAQEE